MPCQAALVAQQIHAERYIEHARYGGERHFHAEDDEGGGVVVGQRLGEAFRDSEGGKGDSGYGERADDDEQDAEHLQHKRDFLP